MNSESTCEFYPPEIMRVNIFLYIIPDLDLCEKYIFIQK